MVFYMTPKFVRLEIAVKRLDENGYDSIPASYLATRPLDVIKAAHIETKRRLTAIRKKAKKCPKYKRYDWLRRSIVHSIGNEDYEGFKQQAEDLAKELDEQTRFLIRRMPERACVGRRRLRLGPV
jgi:hypothetical protein